MEEMVITDNYQEVFEKQKQRAKKLRSEPIKFRSNRLKKLENWILAHRDEIKEAMFKDFRKTGFEVDLSETYATLGEIRDARKNLKYWTRPKRVGNNFNFIGSSAHIKYEPRGVALIISPWNYPFMLTVGPLVSAIAAGNTAIIKPSEFTAHTSQLIQDMVEELFDQDIAVVYQGDHVLSGALLSLPFDHIFFTGSPQVGKIVMEAAARNLSSVTLELGGKSPVIIDKSADLKDTAQKIAWGKWLNAGQSCVAPDYVLVHEDRKDEFIHLLTRYTDRLYKDENQTAIISEKHFDRLAGLMEDALDKGATLVRSGKVDRQSRYFGLNIFSDVTMDMDLMKEEIFGPILPVLSIQSVEHAMEMVETYEKPLALYIFSTDKKINKRIISETTAGGMAINECVLHFGHPELPFGGINNSGIGNAHGYYGFRAFSHEKAVLKQRRGFTMAKTLYPPLDTVKRKTLDFLIKYM